MSKLDRKDYRMFQMRLDGMTYELIGEKHKITSSQAKSRIEEVHREYRRLHARSSYTESALLHMEKAFKDVLVMKENTLFEDILIGDIEMSIKSSNALSNEGITNLGDLAYWEERYLLKIPNFGRKSLNELKEICNTYGIVIGSLSNEN